MKPYPRNYLPDNIVTPIYTRNDQVQSNSRYSIYRIISNMNFPALEIKLTNSISTNNTYKGYYYTTTTNETLYQIAKEYYGDENYYWIIAKANNIKNDGLTRIEKGNTIVIPNFIELSSNGGYFTMNKM